MLNVLVLGRTGMLGQMVSRVLSRTNGLNVKSTSRNQPSDPLYFNVEDGPAALRNIFEAHGPFDYAINCIGVLHTDITEHDSASVYRAALVNTLFPHQLSAIAREFRVRVIHISTDAVFPPSAGVCFEDTPQNCDDVYGKTKSLGEVIAPQFLNVRCSIIGSDPVEKKGLLEWFKAQPAHAEVRGYKHHLWTGATTLQFAQLCRDVILSGNFDDVREESHVHHFCPNETVSKYDLLRTIQSVLGGDVTITPTSNEIPPVTRTLASRYSRLKAFYNYGGPIRSAIDQLALFMK